jgi:uncharacterized membrane protein
MTLTPFHVIGGVTGVVSGLVALYTLKGGPLHRRSGTIFVYAMLLMSLSGAVLAVGRQSAAMNIPAGLITAYLVFTGLLAVQPRWEGSARIERGAMLTAFALGAATIASAFVSAAAGHRAFAPPLIIFGALALSAGAGDLRMIRAGGLQGTARVKRHLWRMSVALFIASASFFLGPVRRIPEPLRLPALRLIPFLVLATMAYWLWRYRRSRRSMTARDGINLTAPEAAR